MKGSYLVLIVKMLVKAPAVIKTKKNSVLLESSYLGPVGFYLFNVYLTFRLKTMNNYLKAVRWPYDGT